MPVSALLSLWSSRLIVLCGLLLWMGVIFGFSMLSGKETTTAPTLSYFLERKGAHVVEYGILLVLAFRFFQLSFLKNRRRDILILSIFFSLAYGATDELHQFFVPFRGARFSDVLIDGLGVAMGALAILLFYRRKNRSR